MIEQFDILDRKGAPTGVRADKGAALGEGEYYLGVHAYIHNAAGAFLLQQRSYDKAFRPGGWDIHMGHVMAGESARQGICREIREEIGLIPDEKNVRFVGRIHWEMYHHMIDAYFVHFDFEINLLKLQKSEVIAVRSITKANMVDFVLAMDWRPKEYRDMILCEIGALEG